MIGGWFLTAFIAFTVSGFIALLLKWGDLISIAVIVPVMIFILIRTHKIHKSHRLEKKGKTSLSDTFRTELQSPDQISHKAISEVIEIIPDILDGIYQGLKAEDLTLLKKNGKKI